LFRREWQPITRRMTTPVSPPHDARRRTRALLDVVAEPYLESAGDETPETLTLGEALEQFVGPPRRAEWDATCGAAAARLEIERPIVAVLGELNAGKSSVVATFLSPEGRRRLPRGDEDAAGTHRFVYWVPQRWLDDADMRRALLQLLAAAHGPGHEDLSLDPATAAEQYCSGREHPERLGVPLVAGDAGLDALGAAFLDCPDVQTRDVAPDAPGRDDNVRLQFVGLAARLCSAFWVVWRRSQVRDRLFRTMLETVRGRMSGAKLCLLLNMIKPAEGQPTKTRRDRDVEQALHDFAVDPADVYGAFDFDSVGWRERTPPALVERFDAEAAADSETRLPQFFQIAGDDAENAPAAVAADRFLLNLPPRLDPAALQEQLVVDHLAELRRVGRATVAEVDAALERRKRTDDRRHAGLFELCHERFVDRGGRAQQLVSRDFQESLERSFLRNAPLYARIPLQVRRVARWTYARLPFAELKETVRDWWRRQSAAAATEPQFFDAGDMAEMMLQRPWVPAEVSRPSLVAAWRATFDAVKHWRPEMSEQALDDITRRFWSDVERAPDKTPRRIVAAVGSLFVLLGLVVAVVDGGATALAASSIAANLSGVAGLGVAGLGVGGVALTAFERELVKLNTLPHLAAMFAWSCDAFGLPRKCGACPHAVRLRVGEHDELYSLPEVEVPPLAVVCPLGERRHWRLAASASEIRRVLTDA
jgi:hypothetical protein